MSFYWRPIPEESGSLPLAGGWLRFSRVERLSRDEAPEIFPAAETPAEILNYLTIPREPICGIQMDRPSVMGIVNATPDSFSDGGMYDAVSQAEKLIADGADLLDIGGESTRPGAAELAVETEISRIIPVIEAVRGLLPISVDTRKADVAQAAISAGAGLVNDVSGFDFDPAMASSAAETGVPVCLMHAQGVPETMQDNPSYDNVLLDVYDALTLRVIRAEAAGIPRKRILIDPGIGFGKTLAHNLAILRRISLFHGLGCPVLLGISRKRFIGTLAGVPDVCQRVPGSLAVTLAAIGQGVQMHRVHDVATMVQGITLWKATMKEAT